MSKTFIYTLIILGVYFFIVLAKKKTNPTAQEFAHDDVAFTGEKQSASANVGKAVNDTVNKVVNNVRGYTL